ncbi:hypothetical protein IAU60_000697 [Kwoniella sp. DSM 27419]
MGKAQTKKKTQGWRHNPVRVPDAHLGGGKAEGKADPEKEKQMLPVLKKLKSPEYADRTWACAAICNLITNDAATRRLFQGKNVVGELIERLSDSVDEVVVEASGALRNLAIDGGHEICGEMANKGLMSHMTVLIGKIASTLDQILGAHGKQDLNDQQYQTRKHLLALTENVISLLWSMAEASPKTLQAVNSTGCEDLLVKVLEGREAMGLGASLAAAHALHSLSQDNPAFRKALTSHPSGLSTFVSVIREDHVPVEQGQKDLAAKVKKSKGKDKAVEELVVDELPDGRALLRRLLVAGTLRNSVLPGSYTDRTVDVASLTSEVILPLANSLLDLNVGTLCDRVMTLVQEQNKDVAKPLVKGFKTDHKPASEVALERVERCFGATVTALELLTNICAGLDEEEEPVNDAEVMGADDDEDEEMDGDAGDEDLIQMGRDPTTVVEPAGPTVVNPGATLSHLLSGLQLPSRLVALSQLNPLSFPPTNSQPSAHPPTTSILSALHLRALEALNNLLLTTVASGSASSQAAGSVPVQQIWEAMFGIVQTIGSEPEALTMRGQEMRVEVLEMAMGCAWGVAKLAPGRLAVQSQQVQVLFDVTRVLQTEMAKTRVIETLSALASRENVGNDENQAIASWLVQLATSVDAEISMVIAALNAIIDIYADETRSYDSVFVQGDYLRALGGIVARVKGEIKKIDRRKDRTLRTRGEEAYENLVAFIKYRRALR